MKKFVSVLLLISTMVVFTACGNTSWVYKYGDKTMKSGLYIAVTMNSYSQLSQQEGYNAEEKDMWKQKIGDKDAKTWIIDNSLKLANSYMAIENKFDELKLTLTDEDNKQITGSFDNEWAQISKMYEDNGVSGESYKNFVINAKKQEKIFNKYYDKDGLEEVPDTTLKTYFKDNFISVNRLTIPLKTGTELTAEDKAANDKAKPLAEGYVKAINDGATFNSIYNKYNLSLPDADATKFAEEKADKDTRGYVKKDTKSPSEKAVKEMFALKDFKKAVLISDETGYHIVVKYDTTDDFTTMRTGILSEMKNPDFKKLIEEWATATKPSAKNTAAINRYDPKNIKIEQQS